MQIFSTDSQQPALRWASAPERKNAALLVLPFATIGATMGGVALVMLARGEPPPGIGSIGLVALATVAGLLLVVSVLVYSAARARFFERQEAAAHAAVEEAVAELQDQLNLRVLMKINRRQIEAYHLLTRQQASDAYKNSVIAMATGLVTLVGGAVAVIYIPGLDSTQRLTTAALTAIGSVVGGYVSRTFMRTYAIALRQLNRYFEQPVHASNLLAAERLIDRISDDRRDRLRVKVIDHLLQAASQPSANGKVEHTRGLTAALREKGS